MPKQMLQTVAGRIRAVSSDELIWHLRTCLGGVVDIRVMKCARSAVTRKNSYIMLYLHFADHRGPCVVSSAVVIGALLPGTSPPRLH